MLALAALGVYSGAHWSLLNQADLFLSVEAQRIAESAAGREGPNLNDIDQAVLTPAIVPEMGHQVQPLSMGRLMFQVIYIRVLTRGERRVLATSPDLSHYAALLPSLDSLLDHANPADTTFTFAGPDPTSQVRVLTRALPGGRTGLWLQVAVPWEQTQNLLERSAVVVGLALPVLLLVAGIGGWILVGRTLAPIQRIVTQAENMDADNVFDVLLPEASETDSEIGHLVSTLNHMLTRLKSAFEAQKRFAEAQQRFAADASHELRTPLTILRGEMELALSRPRSVESYQGTIQSAIEEIDRMSQIVQALSFLARQDALQMASEPVRQPIDLVTLGRTVVNEFEAQARDKQITLDFTPDGPARVLGDEGQLHQLVRNLVDNAVKYTPSGGTVRVRTGRDGTGFRLAVEDTGIGISPEDLPHVFERFWRADKARTASGSGLGLAISARLAELNGGRLAASSTPGQGSCFTLHLPAEEVAESRVQTH